MSINVVQVFNGASSEGLVTTEAVRNPSFFFLSANGIGVDQYEIAACLTVDIVSTNIIGGIPILTGYGSKEVPVPIDTVDTGQLTIVPCELFPGDLNVSLCMVFAYSVNVTVYAAVAEQSIGDVSESVFETILDAILRELLPSVLRLILPGILGEIVAVVVELLLPSGGGGTDIPSLPGGGVPLLPGT